MSLENGKCTSCGANIQVDPGQDSAFCMYCGTKITTSEAVAKYRVVLEGNMRVDGVAEKQKLKDAANILYKNRKFDEAIRLWRKVLEIDPTDWESNRGTCLAEMDSRPKDQFSTSGTHYIMACQYAPPEKAAEFKQIVSGFNQALAEAERRAAEAAAEAERRAAKEASKVKKTVALIMLIVYLVLAFFIAKYFYETNGTHVTRHVLATSIVIGLILGAVAWCILLSIIGWIIGKINGE